MIRQETGDFAGIGRRTVKLALDFLTTAVQARASGSVFRYGTLVTSLLFLWLSHLRMVAMQKVYDYDRVWKRWKSLVPHLSTRPPGDFCAHCLSAHLQLAYSSSSQLRTEDWILGYLDRRISDIRIIYARPSLLLVPLASSMALSPPWKRFPEWLDTLGSVLAISVASLCAYGWTWIGGWIWNGQLVEEEK
jgi:hypothetical protein